MLPARCEIFCVCVACLNIAQHHLKPNAYTLMLKFPDQISCTHTHSYRPCVWRCVLSFPSLNVSTRIANPEITYIFGTTQRSICIQTHRSVYAKYLWINITAFSSHTVHTIMHKIRNIHRRRNCNLNKSFVGFLVSVNIWLSVNEADIQICLQLQKTK